uniref:Cryptochrome DASH n=1 Tax=Lingulaulax polyedra TaxID=160621 RepID=A0A516AG35_LINPO|nr:cryptochrome DASH [Lingulodinium polyedra]
MPATPRVNVVWFKCTDLRTHDHAALRAAHAGGLPVLHLYVFDPFWHANRTRICGFPKTGAVRTRFQLEAIADLSQRLAAEGHMLNTRTGVSTAACFEELCEDYAINAVFAFHEVCSEELAVEAKVRRVLQRRGQGPLRLLWGFELYHREDLSFDPASPRAPFGSYTAFRKRVEGASRVRASAQEAPNFRRGADAAVRWPRSDKAPPSVREVMGPTYEAAEDPGEEKDPRAELRWQGGETAALARVKEYLWDEDCLGLEYVGATMTTDPSKSCMRDKAMSKMSPWLAHGCLSPRLLYEEVQRYERERRKTKSTYWITHELLWRDFVRFGSIQAGTSIFRIGGPKNVRSPWGWSTDQDLFRAWAQGRTGFPFVDCFMRELKATGYCNHMGRECAGWFLIGDLGIDWRMGAEWFESVLVDYEPTANWFNWTYRCLEATGRGAAPRERLQGVEILRWGTQHDPDSTWIKRWLPELAPLPSTVAREPWRLGLREPRAASAGAEGRGLRAAPQGRFDVPREALAAVLALGFEQSEAAIALHRAWNDPDAAVELLLSERAAAEGQQSAEEDDMAQAIKLSLQEAGAAGAEAQGAAARDEDAELAKALDASMGLPGGGAAGRGRGREPAGPHGGFRYGHDYPKPIIQPVSIMNTEEAEEQARRQQARRDREIAAAKHRRGRSEGGYPAHAGGSFNKGRWEEARRSRPAETPTGASWRGGEQDRAEPSKGMGNRGSGGGAAPRDETTEGGGRQCYYSGQGEGPGAAKGDRKRRWGDNRWSRLPADAARGG